MRKKTKFWISFFIILAFAIAVFFTGWVQLRVPAGKHAVMISKTNGIDKQTIEPGKFAWRWQAILPTNINFRRFNLKPYEYETEIESQLPSAQIYATMIEGSPDFTFDLYIKTEISMKSDFLGDFVEKTDAKTDAELEEYLEKQSSQIAKDVSRYLAKEAIRTLNTECYYMETEDLKKAIHADDKYKWIDIARIEIEADHLPDFEMYNLAKKSYAEFQLQVKKAVIQLSKEESFFTAEDYIQLERFSRWGRILNEYPILIEYFKYTSKDAPEFLKNENGKF
ncbi:MAG: hypothetical protein SPI86_09190 [Treponemataceae bacterium]|nr:hypothetical protein [Spirochaetales bacterium]MDY6031914.1 hypothetical protein [Treponemataceae bacterium]